MIDSQEIGSLCTVKSTAFCLKQLICLGGISNDFDQVAVLKFTS